MPGLPLKTDLGERFALSRGKTPLDVAREKRDRKMEQSLLNPPAWAPQVMVFVGFIVYRAGASWNETTATQLGSVGRGVEIFENMQYHLEACWTSRYFLNAGHRFFSSIVLEVQKCWISHWLAQSPKWTGVKSSFPRKYIPMIPCQWRLRRFWFATTYCSQPYWSTSSLP